MKNKLKNRQGISTLTLVFIIASFLTMIIFILQSISLLGARRANQIRYSQASFFGAEGALYETIQHLRNDPDWPSSFGEDTYSIGKAENEVKIKRTLSEGDEGEIIINITATIKGRKRKVVATFTRSIKEPIPLDIILVIDRSGSMETDPIDDAIAAAKYFVDFIENVVNKEGVNHRIGLVSYATSVTEESELVEVGEYGNLKTVIDNLSVSLDPNERRTNISEAIYTATAELDDNARGEAIKVIVFLSDGVANESYTPCSGCGTYPCSDTCCTDDAKNQADTAKPKSYIIFSILLDNITLSDCGDIDLTKELGRETLKAIAYDPSFYSEIDESDDLEAVYAKIAEMITSPEFFEYQEAVPEPD